MPPGRPHDLFIRLFLWHPTPIASQGCQHPVRASSGSPTCCGSPEPSWVSSVWVAWFRPMPGRHPPIAGRSDPEPFSLPLACVTPQFTGVVTRVFAPCPNAVPLIPCLLKRPLTCTFAVGTDLNLYLLCASTRRMSHPTYEVLPATPTRGVDDDIERITCGDDFSLISCL